MTLPLAVTSQTLFSTDGQTQFAFTLTYQRGTAQDAFLVTIDDVLQPILAYTIEEPIGDEPFLETFTLTLVEALVAGQVVEAVRSTEASQNTALVQGQFPNSAVETALDRIYMLLQENRSVIADNKVDASNNNIALVEIEEILNSLSDVAFSGDYGDLINAPNLSTSLFSNVDASITAFWDFFNDITVQGVPLKAKTDLNATAIGVNAQGILDNAGDITNVESDILTNTGNIGVNTSNISANTSSIGDNASDIGVAQSDIISNSNRLTVNEGEITGIKSEYAKKTNSENITGEWSHAGDLNAQFFVGDGSKLTNLPITGDNVLEFQGAFGTVSGNDLPIAGQTNGDAYICDSDLFLASDGKTYDTNDTAVWSDNLGDFYKVASPSGVFAKVDENEIITGNWNFSNDILVDGVFLKAQADATKALAETNEADLIVTNVAVGVNAGDIASNVLDIATNVTDIGTNTADNILQDVEIGANNGNIATNVIDIGTNTGNIATNSADIIVLQGQSFDPSGDENITGNWSFSNDIIVEGVSLKAKVDQNETDIGVNSSSIVVNEGRLDTIESDYTQKAVDETVTGLWSYTQRLNVQGIPIPVIYSGAVAPDDLLGEDGDVFIQV